MIKDVLLNLAIGPERDPAADFAVSLAAAFDAHVGAVAFVAEPSMQATIGVGDALYPAWIDARHAELEKGAKAAIARFEEAVRRSAISAETRLIGATIGGAPDLLGRMARRFDLTVVLQADPNRRGFEDLFIESALFDSGRPTLVIPYIQTAGLKLDRVLACWDGSRSAARAVADALPFLARAGVVEVLTIESELKSNEVPAADIAHHLARHGLKVEVERIANPDVDVPNTILSHATDTGTNLIVMGGYGHSRLREFVLGGATRGILSSMTVPTLMSH